MTIPRHDLTHFQQVLSSGESAQNLTQRLLSQAKSPAAQHVFIHLDEACALQAAAQFDAQRASGQAPMGLAGMPISLKDLFDVQAQVTTSASLSCQDDAPALKDAPVVQRLRQAGAIFMGRTNMSEFAFSGVGINPHFGTPINPSDSQVARIPGGSSSGAAVSVALGLAAAGIGSDTGGSLRIPAALCGLVGFKPTQARIPLAGTNELARSLDTVGAITHCVKDALALDAVLSGQVLSSPAKPLSAMRVAVPTSFMLDDLEPAVARAFERVLRVLSAQGVQVLELAVPELSQIAEINQPGGLSSIEAYAAQRHRIAADPSRIDPRVLLRMMQGKGVNAADYLRLLDQRLAWQTRMNQRLQGFDALICPTVPMVAPPIADVLHDDEAFFRVNRLLLRNPSVVNFWDGCAFSLPCHAPGEMPVGLMLSAAHGQDAALAGLALLLETALGNFPRP